jgi:hypothetical protein
MAFDSDAAAVHRAHRATRQLVDFGLDLPAAVQQAVDVLDTLTAAAPRPPSAAVQIDAILAGDTDAAQAAALAEATFDVRRIAHAGALARAAQHILDALRAAGPALLRDLSKLAAGHAQHVADADALGATTLEALVAAGRHKDAETFVTADAHQQAINQLQQWADRHLGRPLDIPSPARKKAGAA